MPRTVTFLFLRIAICNSFVESQLDFETYCSAVQTGMELIMQIICLKPIPRRSHRAERPDDCLFENRSTSHVPHSETLESFLLTQLIICRWLDFVIQQERIPTLRRFTIKPEPSGGCDYSIKGRQNCLNTLCLQRHSSTS